MTRNNKQNEASTWIKIIARIGFLAKGIIYFSIGVLAFQIAIGVGGSTSDSTQILKKFIYQPFGTVLLSLCMVGLLAHALWKFINGLMDAERIGTDLSGLFFRFIEIIIGFLYLSLSYATLQILQGKGAKSSDQSTQIWISKILTLPHGKAIVFTLAAVVVIIGGYQFYSVFTGAFEYRFNFNEMNAKEQKIIRLLGSIGIGAWGIVYFMMAFLFYRAAQNANPGDAGGLGDALSALAGQPYGAWVLGVTSGGLIIYGTYLFTLTYYHKLDA